MTGIWVLRMSGFSGLGFGVLEYHSDSDNGDDHAFTSMDDDDDGVGGDDDGDDDDDGEGLNAFPHPNCYLCLRRPPQRPFRCALSEPWSGAVICIGQPSNFTQQSDNSF